MGFRKKARKAFEAFHFEPTGFEEKGGTMRLAEDMRALAQEIANSFDARVAGLAALRQKTVDTLKGFQQEMKNVRHELRRRAADLRRFLSNAHASRMRDFRAMHEGIRAGQEARSREVGGMLSDARQMAAGFRRDHQAAGSHWSSMAAALAKKRASLAR